MKKISDYAKTILRKDCYRGKPMVFAKKLLTETLDDPEDAFFADEIVNPVILEAARIILEMENEQKNKYYNQDESQRVLNEFFHGNVLELAERILSEENLCVESYVIKEFICPEILEVARLRLMNKK